MHCLMKSRSLQYRKEVLPTFSTMHSVLVLSFSPHARIAKFYIYQTAALLRFPPVQSGSPPLLRWLCPPADESIEHLDSYCSDLKHTLHIFHTEEHCLFHRSVLPRNSAPSSFFQCHQVRKINKHVQFFPSEYFRIGASSLAPALLNPGKSYIRI